MSLEAAYILPHPPLAIPEVGRGQERQIADTIRGYQQVAAMIAANSPDTIVIISPHTAYYSDWIYVAGGTGATGNMAQFGVPDVTLTVIYDAEFRTALERACRARDIPAGPIKDEAQPLDHGMMVPLYYLDQAYPASAYKVVSVGGSAVPRAQLEAFGRCITRTADAMGRRTVLLVSGDLSHKLKEDGPYGFHPSGPAFDAAFVDIVKSGDLSRFSDLESKMCSDAAECGLSGFIMMAAALDELRETQGSTVDSQLISYEGPFGVGYGVAAFQVEGGTENPANFANAPDSASMPEQTSAPASGAADEEGRYSQDALVDLAYRTVNQFVRSGQMPDADKVTLPPDVPQQAGCFVSIHMRGTDDLRGCIGTIQPTCPTLAEEVIQNAVSAATRDPRFPPISPDELPDLTINVDVLFPPEPANVADLDAKRFGVIVTMGGRRGLLLPDLEGVDTPEQQIAIACAKAGIPHFGPDVELERFEVVRHT